MWQEGWKAVVLVVLGYILSTWVHSAIAKLALGFTLNIPRILNTGDVAAL